MKTMKTEAHWNKAMEFDGVSVVDFYMSYCPPCQKLKPILEELEKEYHDANAKIMFSKIEVDTLPNKTRRFHVDAAPSLFFFINGIESGRKIVGLKEKPAIKTRCDAEIERYNRQHPPS